jgi:hypothetical protein
MLILHLEVRLVAPEPRYRSHNSIAFSSVRVSVKLSTGICSISGACHIRFVDLTSDATIQQTNYGV